MPRSEYRGRFIQVRVTNAEYRELAAAAEKDGVRLSEWVRRALFKRLGNAKGK